MNDPDYQNEFGTEPQLDRVEKLLSSMSLKKPSASLESNIVLNRPDFKRRIVREWIIALACLLCGILIGAAWPESDNETDSVVSNSTQELEEPSIWDLADQRTANAPIDPLKVGLVDEGFCLINGDMPARKYTTIANKTLVVIDPETGKPIQITIPIRKTVLSASVGT